MHQKMTSTTTKRNRHQRVNPTTPKHPSSSSMTSLDMSMTPGVLAFSKKFLRTQAHDGMTPRVTNVLRESSRNQHGTVLPKTPPCVILTTIYKVAITNSLTWEI